MDRGVQRANFCYSERGWPRGSTISAQASIHSIQIIFSREGITNILTNYLGDMITNEIWLSLSILFSVIVSISLKFYIMVAELAMIGIIHSN